MPFPCGPYNPTQSLYFPVGSGSQGIQHRVLFCLKEANTFAQNAQSDIWAVVTAAEGAVTAKRQECGIVQRWRPSKLFTNQANTFHFVPVSGAMESYLSPSLRGFITGDATEHVPQRRCLCRVSAAASPSRC